MSMTLRRRDGRALDAARVEDGAYTLSTMIGAALGAMVIGGFALFWFTANDSSQTNVVISAQEGDAIKVLNRASQDIGDADTVVKAEPDEVVVERVDREDRESTITRTRYAVVKRSGTPAANPVYDMVREVDEDADAGFDPNDAGSFDADGPTVVLARDVIVPAAGAPSTTEAMNLTYRTRDGSLAAAEDPTSVGRVDISYAARTKRGNVALKSSATVNTALGGSGDSNGSLLEATDDGVTIIAGESALVNVLSNDVFADGPRVTASPVAPLGVTVDASNQVLITAPSSITVPGIYTVPYTLTDDSGVTDTANITVAVQVRASTAAPTSADVCTTDGRDTITIPSRTGIDYFIDGVLATPGVKTMTPPSAGADFTRVVTAAPKTLPEPGYVLAANSATEWTFQFTDMPCFVEPWVSEAPQSLDDTVGQSTIAWSGGPLRYVRMAGADGNPVSGTLSTALSSERSAEQVQATGLDTNYLYYIDKDKNGVHNTGEQSFRLSQFPSVPDVAATGSDPDGDKVAESAWIGTNQVSFTKATTTVDTDLLRYTSFQGPDGRVYLRPSPATVAKDTQQAYLTETSRARGTESVYDAVATTSCVTKRGGPAVECPSFNADTSTRVAAEQYLEMAPATAYQVPGAVPVGLTGGNPTAAECYSRDNERLVNDVSGGANNGAYDCGTGGAQVAWKATNSDDGAPSGSKFCGYQENPGDCEVKTQAAGQTAFSARNSLDAQQSSWNSRDAYRTYSCNLGGCNTDSADTTLRSFPGPFNIDGVRMPPERRFQRIWRWYNPGCWGSLIASGECEQFQDIGMKVSWTQSNGLGDGSGRYSMNAVPHSGVVKQYPDDTGPYVADTGNHSGGAPIAQTDWLGGFRPTSGYMVSTTARSSLNPGFIRKSTSGVTGRAAAHVFTSPGSVSYMQDTAFCHPDINNGWRYGAAFTSQTLDHRGETRNGMNQQIRHMWWVSPINNDREPDAAAPNAARQWLNGTNNPTNWVKPENWQWDTEYWANNTVGSLSNSWHYAMTGSSNSSLIPPDGPTRSPRAYFRVEVFVSNADAGNPDYADLTYWTGTGSDGNGGTTNGQVHGSNVQARSNGNNAKAIADCSASGRSNAWTYTFNSSSTNWYQMHNAAATTRRYQESRNNIGKTGSPNPDSGGAYVSWRQAMN